MAEPTNLTERLAHLRDKKDRKSSLSNSLPAVEPASPQREKAAQSRSTKRATDYFALAVYLLLGTSLVFQFGLIFWMDL